ncbi:class I SAM-dependent methyltransferase [Methanoplanus sp. FWC-SCC4]|uniref:Class I SAM-dependent methyltransferase n=1 Tax=Methanochimaera problematica TaxID=2609417 RepID=A0AA97I442_9EURY|nr:class I SAM-dependent methyltransferase [Methanoplanus sp. FWC-SCC4]WOF16124.1 class I SAM-dependent methyltransferase [Methanoplanus sp. FWC-SCC4]
MEKGKEHFDGIENEYERMIIKIIPSAEDFFGSALSFVPDKKIRVLELGSGTGFVTSMIIEKNKYVDITCIDLSPGMLEVAMKKPELSDVCFIAGDFREIWGEGNFDVVITTLCLHHLPGQDREMIIKKIYDSLNKGGVFINGDVFTAGNSNEEKMNLEWWKENMIENGLPLDEADSMIQKRINNSQYFDTIHGYYRKMKSAGFKDIYHPYKNRIYSTFAGFK